MSTYTPFDNLTDDEFLRWLELNLQDSRKDAIIARLQNSKLTNGALQDEYDRGYQDGKEDYCYGACPACGEDLT